MKEEYGNRYLKAFGENLKKSRKKKSLSLRNLSTSCSIDYSDISKIEKGKVNITIMTLTDLAKGLDIHPQKLLDFEFDFEE